ncbi:hypothetical protein E1A91_D08G143400v1 [Gossypium mustelinum]|nr:hypothetical protein ES319_D08G143300v1 [Gossypium barbadense]TYI69276.1 hypothetical protein E1A91_D08G143400v1 [Gossypium mustelinum]
MHPNLSDILGAGQKPSFHSSPMGSMLGNLPSFDPHNFSQLRPSDPSNPSKMVPSTYRPTHSRTLPPPDQVEIETCCHRTSNTRAWMQAN